MHTKSELESMTLDELHALAKKIGATSSNDFMTQVYNIIDKESELPNTAEEAPKKKRTRISKAEKAAQAQEAEAPANNDAPAAEVEKKPKRTRTKKVVEENPVSETEQNATVDAEKTEQKVAEPSETVAEKNKSRRKKANAPAAENTTEEPKKKGRGRKLQQDTPDFIITQPFRPAAEILAENFGGKPVAPKTEEEKQEATAPKQQTPRYNFGDAIKGEGVLEIGNDGVAILRSSNYNYMPSPDDIVLPNQFIRLFGLKTGDTVAGLVTPPTPSERHFTMHNVIMVNGCDPRTIRERSPFEHLTPLFPNEKFQLCSGENDPVSVRVVDLFAPIGKGQRALIVAQPKTGKTILMKDIANAIARNHPEAYLMMLLVDERPEEVTDMSRTVNAEVIASTFDEPAERHVRIANIVLEKAKRMVECGHDVVIFLDSITRLARAYNTVQPASGKILTGGVDANAMHKPKRFFGAARNIENGGSLTIIATALTDTGSKMDEVIFEEFKGTGNMELQLDRLLANKRIFPAVNVIQSSTRRDDLLLDKKSLDRTWIIRKYFSDFSSMEAMNTIVQNMEETKSNDEFLEKMNS